MLKLNQVAKENAKVAFQSFKGNGVRTYITIAIIAVGITALVGILTSISAIEASVAENLSALGSNTFSISEKVPEGRGRRRGAMNTEPLSYDQVRDFKRKFDFPCKVGLKVEATGSASVRFKSEKTNPNVSVVGVDENFFETTKSEVEVGRLFSAGDIKNNVPIAVIGMDLVKKFFDGNPERSVGKEITVGSLKVMIVGVLKSKGSGFGGSQDNFVYLPITRVRERFYSSGMSFEILGMVSDPSKMSAAQEEARGVMRKVRKDPMNKPDSFDIDNNASLTEMNDGLFGIIAIVGTTVGLITLIGAAIGLMNIMLVSVKERTKEIGTRKALGATAKTIQNQFLLESILIGQFGGILGIFLGFIIGNVVGLFIGAPIVVPWGWMFLGAFLCFLVGILSGYFPARMAAKLDPIEALRYE